MGDLKLESHRAQVKATLGKTSRKTPHQPKRYSAIFSHPLEFPAADIGDLHIDVEDWNKMTPATFIGFPLPLAARRSLP